MTNASTDKPSPGNRIITGKTARGEACDLPPSTPAPETQTVGEHGFVGTREQLANALYECGERNGATASAVCKTAADIVRTLPNIKALPLDDYMKVHDAAVAEYERSTSRSAPYSAAALRRAVDAAFHTFAALTTEGQPDAS